MSVIALTLIACKSEPVRVACVGDSITYGHGIKDRLHDAYPGVLSSMLGEVPCWVTNMTYVILA